MSGFFFLLTLIVWERYVKKQSIGSYAAALLLFVLGLMSKPMLVTVPIILLLLDWWPLGRCTDQRGFKRLFMEKIPFFLLTAVFSLVTLLGQNQAGAVVSFNTSPITLRLANAVISYGAYLRKMLWPNDLVVFYPYPDSIHWVPLAVCLILLIVSTVVFLRLRWSYPYLIVGWFWYLVMLFPVIGVIRVGAQAMADRYTYLPLLGPFIMIVWGTAEAATRPVRKCVIAVCAGIVAGLLSFSAWQQAGYWQNDIILFARVLEYEPVTPLALTAFARSYIKKGVELKKQWDFDESLKYFTIAAARSTGTLAAIAHNNIGLIRAMQERDAEAMREYRIAVKQDPAFTDASFNMGLLYLEQGRRNEAAACFREVVRLNPNDEKARRYLREVN